MNLIELKAERVALLAKVKSTDEAIAAKLSHTLVRCGQCRIGHEVRELIYLQTHWYESPHGCSGGDTWHAGEGQWACPDCGHTNRLYDNPDVTALKPLFKLVNDKYKD